MRFRLVAALLLMAALGGGVYYWYAYMRPAAPETAAQGEAPAAGGFAMPVEAAPVIAEQMTLSIPAVGTLRSNESVVLSPEIAGRIAELNIEEGRPVQAGSVVAVLDQSVYKAEVAQIEASLALSRANHERAEELLAKNAGTVRARDEAVAALRADQASLALARAQLEKTVITAPFDGVLGLRRVSAGQYLSAGDEIVNLEDIDPLKVDFRVPEIYFAVVAVGQTIHLSVDAFPDDSFTGTVYAIDPLIDVNGRAIVIRASVPNPDARLRPGLFTRVRLVYESRENTLFVPEQALMPIGDAQNVFRIVDGKAMLTRVATGERVGANVEIRDGLAAGDLVVTAGQIKLQDGAPVAVLPPETAPEAAPADGAPAGGS